MLMRKKFQAKVAGHLTPVGEDPPLNLNVPKPLFANARTGSAFGFQSSGSMNQDAAQLSKDQWDATQDADADGMDIDEDSHKGFGMICPLSCSTLTFFHRSLY
jgi:hypothetical protein